MVYVHDTPQCIRFKFADDLASTSVADDVSSVPLLQDALDQMSEWAGNWDMSLNTPKTRKCFSVVISLECFLVLERSRTHCLSFKYLGVWLDEKLNFHAQAEYSAKATKAFPKIVD